MKNRKLSLRVQLLEALEYLGETKWYLLVIFALFVVSTAFGFVFYQDLTFFDKILENIISQTKGLSGFELILFILQNNLQSAFLGLVLGVFFGIFPIINSLTNGSVLGYVLARAVRAEGIGVIWRLFPHGIFELPAVFIALALGVKLGMFIFSDNKTKELKRRFYNSINVFLVIVVPLLIIAAIIEGLLIVFFS